MPVDTQAATDRLMRFLAVEGVTGKEAAIGRELTAALKESGVPADAIRLDDANTRIPVPTETGNLIVDLPGRGGVTRRAGRLGQVLAAGHELIRVQLVQLGYGIGYQVGHVTDDSRGLAC